MGNYVFNVPSLGNKFVDYRDPIPGDSYTWSWERPLSQVQYLAIHHTAGPDTQTPDEIASFHVNSRGWGGVGYHFIISKNGTVYYVGDLTTARANVLDKNHLVIGICLIGTFMNGIFPSSFQLQSVHELCKELLLNTPELSGVSDWSKVVGHRDLQSTDCPGDTWSNWRQKIVTGVSSPPSSNQRVQQIIKIYQMVFGRDPNQTELNQYVQSNLSIEEIRKAMTESTEHQTLLKRAKNFSRVLKFTQEAKTLSLQFSSKLDEIIQLGE